MKAAQDIVVKMDALRALIDALLLLVEEAGIHGQPSGTLYAALMPSGITLIEYERLMRLVLETGRIHKRGHLYFSSPPAGKPAGPMA